MTGYYLWDRTVRPPVSHFIQADDGVVVPAAGLWKRWKREDVEDELFESFAILTHANRAATVPLTPNGPVFIAGLTERARLILHNCWPTRRCGWCRRL